MDAIMMLLISLLALVLLAALCLPFTGLILVNETEYAIIRRWGKDGPIDHVKKKEAAWFQWVGLPYQFALCQFPWWEAPMRIIGRPFFYVERTPIEQITYNVPEFQVYCKETAGNTDSRVRIVSTEISLRYQLNFHRPYKQRKLDGNNIPVDKGTDEFGIHLYEYETGNPHRGQVAERAENFSRITKGKSGDLEEILKDIVQTAFTRVLANMTFKEVLDLNAKAGKIAARIQEECDTVDTDKPERNLPLSVISLKINKPFEMADAAVKKAFEEIAGAEYVRQAEVAKQEQQKIIATMAKEIAKLHGEGKQAELEAVAKGYGVDKLPPEEKAEFFRELEKYNALKGMGGGSFLHGDMFGFLAATGGKTFAGRGGQGGYRPPRSGYRNNQGGQSG